MKRVNIAPALFIFLPLYWASATNLYVSVAGTNNTPPFTNWPLSCSNIQWVVNASANGDVIYITNGHFYLTNYVNIAKAITLISYNQYGNADPTNTIIDANNYTGKPVTNRCMNINNTGAVVIGFTLTNGIYTDGAGCRINLGLLTNCIVTGNLVTNSAGAAYEADGAGVYLANASCVAANCQIIGNRAVRYGGAIYCSAGSVVKNCLIGWNSADAANGSGVIVISSTSVVHGCTIISNTSTLYGGSTLYYYDDNSMISNCLVRYNSGLTFFMNNNNANTLNINWGIHLTGVAATCSMRGDGRLSP